MELPGNKVKTKEASLTKRVIAALFDVIVLAFVILNPFSGVLGAYFSGSFNDAVSLAESSLPNQIGFIMFIIMILFFVYFTLFQYYYKQTIGMMIMRIQVHGDITFGKCMIRSLIGIPTFPFYILWFIEPLLIALNRKALLEQLTNTTTIERRQ